MQRARRAPWSTEYRINVAVLRCILPRRGRGHYPARLCAPALVPRRHLGYSVQGAMGAAPVLLNCRCPDS